MFYVTIGLNLLKDGLFSYLGPTVILLDIMSLGWDGDEKAVSESNFLEVIIFSNSVSLMTVQFSEQHCFNFYGRHLHIHSFVKPGKYFWRDQLKMKEN